MSSMFAEGWEYLSVCTVAPASVALYDRWWLTQQTYILPSLEIWDSELEDQHQPNECRRPTWSVGQWSNLPSILDGTKRQKKWEGAVSLLTLGHSSCPGTGCQSLWLLSLVPGLVQASSGCLLLLVLNQTALPAPQGIHLADGLS